ncbi:InlB B-repeat-containing protein [Flavobacteriaceae bacterium]|nr:InlB B-repeat-containing protein [Flavobacteriaceae bacterium]
MKNYRSISLLFLSLIIITCSKESDVASDAYSSSASQNTYNPPSTTTTTVTQFTLAVSASAGGGTVSTEGGDFEEGTEVTITATANEGYRFTGWEGSDSTSESLTVTLNSDQTYQALFELVPVYTLSVTASAGGGTVSTEGGDFEEGTEVTITATANEGYEFVGWNGTDMSSSTITIMLTANTTIEALFSQVSTTTTVTQFTLAVSASAGGGTVSTEGGDFEEGTEVTITATANEGYRFTGWEGSDSTSESLTVTLNSDQTYQALFELIPVSVSVYTISVTAQGSANYILSGDDANGSVSGNDPSVSLKVGDTLNFNVNAQGHPFYLIKTSNGGFGSSNLIDGVSNNGTVSATVSWTPTEGGTYYYICEYHPSMLGTITVTE